MTRLLHPHRTASLKALLLDTQLSCWSSSMTDVMLIRCCVDDRQHRHPTILYCMSERRKQCVTVPDYMILRAKSQRSSVSPDPQLYKTDPTLFATSLPNYLSQRHHTQKMLALPTLLLACLGSTFAAPTPGQPAPVPSGGVGVRTNDTAPLYHTISDCMSLPSCLFHDFREVLVFIGPPAHRREIQEIRSSPPSDAPRTHREVEVVHPPPAWFCLLHPIFVLQSSFNSRLPVFQLGALPGMDRARPVQLHCPAL